MPSALGIMWSWGFDKGVKPEIKDSNAAEHSVDGNILYAVIHLEQHVARLVHRALSPISTCRLCHADEA